MINQWYPTSQFPDFRLHALHAGFMAVGACQCSVPFFTLQSGNRQDASDDPSPSTLACVYRCLWTSTSSTCFPMPTVVRNDTSWHNSTVEIRLVVSFCGQSYYCNSPSIWQLAFKLTCHTHMHSGEYLLNRFWTGQRLCRSNMHKCGLVKSLTCNCGRQHTMNNIINTCSLFNHEIWMCITTTSRGWRWCSQVAAINGN